MARTLAQATLRYRPCITLPIPPKNSTITRGNLDRKELRTLTPPNLPALAPQIRPALSRINLNPTELRHPLVALFTHSETAWLRIRDEPLSATTIFERYVFLLAAIGPLCGTVGFTLTGALAPATALFYGFSSYGLILLFFFGATYLAHLLAPVFGGRLTLDSAAKLIVYSFMPFFVSLAFFLFPPICFLSLIGVYGIVLFFRGVPILSGIPASKQILFLTINAVAWLFFVEMMRCSVFAGVTGST